MITTANFMRPAEEAAKPKPRYRFDVGGHVHYIGYDHSDVIEWKPLMGTSTVVGVLGKPLTYWAAGCALAPLGWLNPKKVSQQERLQAAMYGLEHMRDLSAAEYMNLLQQCYHAHTKVKDLAATDGTSTHKALEHYVQSCIDDNGGEPCQLLKYGDAVEVFSTWADKHVNRFFWSEKHCYSEKLWVGGVSDCGAQLRNGRRAIIDFKRKGCYHSQSVQIGGYACQIAESGLFDAEGNEYMPPWAADDVIVFPNTGNPRTERAERFMLRFAEVVNIYMDQQQYEAA